MILLYKLLIAHFLTDYVLQPPSMGRGKNRHVQPTYVPPGQKPVNLWPYHIVGHACINAGGVWLATGSIECALAENVLHGLIDFLKCESITNPHIDQALHLACKIGYVWYCM